MQESENLAAKMANLARQLRNDIIIYLKQEEKETNLIQLFNTFKKRLDLDISEFADIYAQNLIICLFTYYIIKVKNPELDIISKDFIKSIPFLDVIFQDIVKFKENKLEFIDPHKNYNKILKKLFNEQNIKLVFQEFKNKYNQFDPIVHFYELFLKKYDPKKRFKRGVFYTPDPVVSFIVRSVDYFLQSELDCKDGLADISRLETKNGSYKVNILDPATGTGKFLIFTIEKIKKFFDTKNKSENRSVFMKDWNDYVQKHLLSRIYGFELLMTPFLIAHLNLLLQLYEKGYKLDSNLKLELHLKNALDDEIIRNKKFTVIFGNPPYSGFPANQGEWITDLVHDYYFVDGEPLKEKNPKWLLDDYVKFIRFGQYYIKQAGFGILSFITPHGYLDNPTFRGMRESLIKDFPIIYIVNLHGNSIKGEKCPDGGIDENIFDIKQGLCIGFFIKPLKKVQNHVYYFDVWGSKEDKLEWLNNKDIDTIKWIEVKPTTPFYLYIPQDKKLWDEYNKGIKLTNIFNVYSAGIATARDHFTIQWTKNDMLKILTDFTQLSLEEARKKYNLRKDVRDWKVSFAQKDVVKTNINPELIVPILYRPFDIRYTYYTGKSRGFLCMPRPEVMKNMLLGENIAFAVSRSVRGAPWRDVLASSG
ncbi:MAG: type ISP restriction/modification enzyme [Promethearchaeota archaeon]